MSEEVEKKKKKIEGGKGKGEDVLFPEKARWSLTRHLDFARSILSIVTPMTKMMSAAISSKIPTT